MADSTEPVRLPRHILRQSQPHPSPPPLPPPVPRSGTAPSFVVGRRTDNELILFHEAAQESWIIYPPRSAYEFLAARRPAPDVTLVEHHSWQPFVEPVDHPLDPRSACRLHGAECGAGPALEAAIRLGYEVFA